MTDMQELARLRRVTTAARVAVLKAKFWREVNAAGSDARAELRIGAYADLLDALGRLEEMLGDAVAETERTYVRADLADMQRALHALLPTGGTGHSVGITHTGNYAI